MQRSPDLRLLFEIAFKCLNYNSFVTLFIAVIINGENTLYETLTVLSLKLNRLGRNQSNICLHFAGTGLLTLCCDWTINDALVRSAGFSPVYRLTLFFRSLSASWRLSERHRQAGSKSVRTQWYNEFILWLMNSMRLRKWYTGYCQLASRLWRGLAWPRRTSGGRDSGWLHGVAVSLAVKLRAHVVSWDCVHRLSIRVNHTTC